KKTASDVLTQTLENTRVKPTQKRKAWLKEQGEPETEQTYTAAELLRRPKIDLSALSRLLPELTENRTEDVLEQAEASIKYAGYLQKEAQQIARARDMEAMLIPGDMDYHAVTGIRIEARQKLACRMPRTLGQAGRIPGVNPSDVAVLMIYLKKLGR
ncbi:MAG: tRNA uridine-5-carboxymethylaminomethyl(34) synthesis enzyme MnmG, partial [Firmicutes bacterium]|nr:tRNA uridine-5-carboxymethylaminomethyl(34) synthesis enzyme MnmG [Bacillota bacterium]